MLWFIGCEYQHREFCTLSCIMKCVLTAGTDWEFPERCDPNRTFWTAALLSVPTILRLLQCLRRFRDSGFTTRLHLVNAGKYTSSVFYSWLYVNYRYHGSARHQDLALWCVFGAIYSCYTIVWDLVMDWSLLRPHARYPFLRDELVFEPYWPFYYFAIVSWICAHPLPPFLLVLIHRRDRSRTSSGASHGSSICYQDQPQVFCVSSSSHSSRCSDASSGISFVWRTSIW